MLKACLVQFALIVMLSIFIIFSIVDGLTLISGFFIYFMIGINVLALLGFLDFIGKAARRHQEIKKSISRLYELRSKKGISIRRIRLAGLGRIKLAGLERTRRKRKSLRRVGGAFCKSTHLDLLWKRNKKLNFFTSTISEMYEVSDFFKGRLIILFMLGWPVVLLDIFVLDRWF